MTVRIVEGEVLTLGSVSGTDGTPFGIWEPTRAARVYLENPLLVPTFEQTVINSTASGSGVQIVGGGIVSVDTAGLVITVSGPEFTELEGDDVDSINTLTGTVTIDGQNNASVITNVPSNTIFIDVPFDDDDVDSINTVTGTVTLDGSDGNTVLPAVGQTITIQGFRPEFVAASGFLQSQIDSPTGTVLSLNTLDGDLTIAGGGFTSVTDNGSDTITVSSIDGVDVDSLTVSATTLTGSITLEAAGQVALSTVGQSIVISGTGSNDSAAVSGQWRFRTTTGGNPGSGRFEMDTGSFGTVTELYFNDITDQGTDATNFLQALSAGDRIYIQTTNDASQFAVFDVTGPSVDNIISWTVPVSVAQSGGFFDNNDRCLVTILFDGAPATVVNTLNSFSGNLNLVGAGGTTLTDNGSDTITITSNQSELVDGDADTSVTVEQPAGNDTDNIVFTVSGTSAGRISNNVTHIGRDATGDLTSRTIAIGNAEALATNSIAIGSDSVVEGDFGIAIGEDAATDDNNGIAIGNGANATLPDAIALGRASSAGANEFKVGDATVPLDTSLTGNLDVADEIIYRNSPGTAPANGLIVRSTDGVGTLDYVSVVGQNTVTVDTTATPATISGAGIASLGFEDDGIPYIDDPTRGNKRLSVHRQHFGFGRNGNADNTYLRVGDALNNESGWVMPRDATITAWSVFYPGGTASKGFEIRVNNVAVALASATVTQDVVTLQKNLNIDINEGDRLQVFVVAAGGNANDANSSIEVAWRR